MVAIPKQTITVRDPGLSVTPAAIETYLFAGTSSKGIVGQIYSFNDPASVVDTLGEGPNPENICRALIEAGGPQLGQRLLGDVAATIGSVTKYPKSTSTGTIAVTTTPAQATKAWQIDDPAGTPVFVDMTTAFNNATTADVTFWPSSEATGDQFAIGFESPFKKFSLTLSTNGVGGTVTYKYWNGTAWTAVAGLTDATTGLTASGLVTFTMPTDWVARSLNGSASLYYLVIEVATVYSTNPIGTSGYIDQYGPHDSYDVTVRIKTTGTLGAGEFDYSLDDGNNYAPSPITIPTGAVYDIPNAGLRLTFTAGGGPTYFEAGDSFTFSCTAPFVSTTSLGAGFTAIQTGTDEFAAYILAGRAATATAGAAMFAALDVQAAALFAAHRFIGCMMDSGIDTAANQKTQYGAVSSSRILVNFETSHVASSKPFIGWGQPKRSVTHVVASRAAASLISTHLGRFADGPLDGVKDISYNEEKGTSAMSAARFCTLRTWQGYTGFYINRPNMMSAAGSDFTLWPHRRIMDTSCDTAHKTLQQFVNSKIRVRTDGTGFIAEKEALRIEGVVNAALGNNLLTPIDAEGNAGHVAAIRYIVDRAYSVKANNKVKGSVAIVRDDYAEEIITELGFAAQAV